MCFSEKEEDFEKYDYIFFDFDDTIIHGIEFQNEEQFFNDTHTAQENITFFEIFKKYIHKSFILTDRPEDSCDHVKIWLENKNVGFDRKKIISSHGRTFMGKMPLNKIILNKTTIMVMFACLDENYKEEMKNCFYVDSDKYLMNDVNTVFSKIRNHILNTKN